jgi:hypothetical protein
MSVRSCLTDWLTTNRCCRSSFSYNNEPGLIAAAQAVGARSAAVALATEAGAAASVVIIPARRERGTQVDFKPERSKFSGMLVGDLICPMPPLSFPSVTRRHFLS